MSWQLQGLEVVPKKETFWVGRNQGQIGNFSQKPGFWRLITKKDLAQTRFLGLQSLRGLCPDSQLESSYMLRFQRNWLNQVEANWTGLMGSELTFDWTRHPGQWELKSHWHNITARSSAAFESHALGRHSWTTTGDTCQADQESYKTYLKLTLCQETGEMWSDP